jgi:hypothetical protein
MNPTNQRIGKQIATFYYTHIVLNRETITSFHVSLFVWGRLSTALAETWWLCWGAVFLNF